MLLSASLSWRCSGRRASGAFKSTGHVDSDIKAAVNSKQSREQTVELIITPEFIPDVFTVQTDSFVLSLPPWGHTWKTFMKQLSLHKVKPDQGRVPADVSGGDECPGSCLSDVVSVSISVRASMFPLCPPRGWTEESHHLQTDSSLKISVAAKQNISGRQRKRWSPSNIIFWHFIDRLMERTHTFTYKDNNHQLQFYFKSQIVFLCDSSKLYFIEIMHDVTIISEKSSRAVWPHRLG